MSPYPSQPDIPMQALAVYCSDGRFTRACDTYITEQLGIEHYDRLVVPGGPGALVAHAHNTAQNTSQAESVFGKVRFLVQAHQLNRVILIDHEDCGFYQLGLGLRTEQIEPNQRLDLDKASQVIREQLGINRIEAYIARIGTGGVVIEPVTAVPHSD